MHGDQVILQTSGGCGFAVQQSWPLGVRLRGLSSERKDEGARTPFLADSDRHGSFCDGKRVDDEFNKAGVLVRTHVTF